MIAEVQTPALPYDFYFFLRILRYIHSKQRFNSEQAVGIRRKGHYPGKILGMNITQRN